MKNMSIRGIDMEVAGRLEAEAKRRGVSINAHVVQILRQGVGLSGEGHPVHHDLDHLAGTWTAEGASEFERHLAAFEQIDEDLWR